MIGVSAVAAINRPVCRQIDILTAAGGDRDVFASDLDGAAGGDLDVGRVAGGISDAGVDEDISGTVRHSAGRGAADRCRPVEHLGKVGIGIDDDVTEAVDRRVDRDVVGGQQRHRSAVAAVALRREVGIRDVTRRTEGYDRAATGSVDNDVGRGDHNAAETVGSYDLTSKHRAAVVCEGTDTVGIGIGPDDNVPVGLLVTIEGDTVIGLDNDVTEGEDSAAVVGEGDRIDQHIAGVDGTPGRDVEVRIVHLDIATGDDDHVAVVGPGEDSACAAIEVDVTDRLINGAGEIVQGPVAELQHAAGYSHVLIDDQVTVGDDVDRTVVRRQGAVDDDALLSDVSNIEAGFIVGGRIRFLEQNADVVVVVAGVDRTVDGDCVDIDHTVTARQCPDQGGFNGIDAANIQNVDSAGGGAGVGQDD